MRMDASKTKKDIDRELPAINRVKMDIVQSTAKLTALEKRRMFHIYPGRPARIWTRETRPTSHMTEIKDIPESDRMTRYQGLS